MNAHSCQPYFLRNFSHERKLNLVKVLSESTDDYEFCFLSSKKERVQSMLGLGRAGEELGTLGKKKNLLRG